MTVGHEFAVRTEPYRSELLAHCYRMLGSIHDAEDLVQETMLRAWRSADRYDQNRASLRTWLYRIATNACLTALEQRGRRALPSGIAAPSSVLVTSPERRPEIAWLEPIPDAMLDGAVDNIRLAFIAALQYLPARQRAVLILRDVLSWSAGEVADLLDTTPAAVNSALQRARTHLEGAAPMLDDIPEPTRPDERATLDRYVSAFRNADLDALTELLRADAVLEMPPSLFWLAGRRLVVDFFAPKVGDRDTWRAVPTAANSQPAVAFYLRDEQGIHRAHSIHVLTVAGAGIARITAYLFPGLFATFGLPASLHG